MRINKPLRGWTTVIGSDGSRFMLPSSTSLLRDVSSEEGATGLEEQQLGVMVTFKIIALSDINDAEYLLHEVRSDASWASTMLHDLQAHGLSEVKGFKLTTTEEGEANWFSFKYGLSVRRWDENDLKSNGELDEASEIDHEKGSFYYCMVGSCLCFFVFGFALLAAPIVYVVKLLVCGTAPLASGLYTGILKCRKSCCPATQES
jgi:hypothetical protein